jgi:hypothetical protein
MTHKKTPLPQAAIPDPEAHAVLVQAMADVGADPALVYAFQKTGVYVCEENEKRLSKAKLAAFNAAVEEYYSTINGAVH